jgi:hypothetical protein
MRVRCDRVGGAVVTRALQVVAMSTALWACGEPGMGGEHAVVLPDAEQGLWNGGNADFLQGILGFVSLSGCSAVAIDPHWVLTMYHCGDRTGQNVSFLGRTYRVDQAFMNPFYKGEGGEQRNDSQLLRLETPLRDANGDEWTTSVPVLTEVTPEKLVGRSLFCLGAAGTSSYKGYMFSGASVTDTGFLNLTSTGAYLQSGDSGGPCFTVDENVQIEGLVSITKGGYKSKPDSRQTQGGVVNPLRSELQDWIFSTMFWNPPSV